MERDIIYYHIAIQQIEQPNKQSIFIKRGFWHFTPNFEKKLATYPCLQTI